MTITPLDAWVRDIINNNITNDTVKNDAVLRADIQAFQLDRLNATIETALKSSYYRQLFSNQIQNMSEPARKNSAALTDETRIASTTRDLSPSRSSSPFRDTLPSRASSSTRDLSLSQIASPSPHFQSLSQLSQLPAIDAEVLKKEGMRLVCAPQGEIARIVTLQTSGSTDSPKRVFFTERDLELTVDYFANGLKTLTAAGDSMAILLPCESPDGIGDLIARGLMRIPVTPVRHGLVGDIAQCVNVLRETNAKSLVGVPVQALALARYCAAKKIKLDIRAVLLSTDNIPRIVVSELERLWGCEVFEHYGMTEMGLGGAIDCEAHDGYHIRENDLLVEILDEKGCPLKDGEYGEVVFTTLTREGMPLIRYKTGDRSMLLQGRCACGSRLRRLAPLNGRIGGDTVMECGTVIRIHEFDKVLFAIPEVSGFTLTAERSENRLKIAIESQESAGAAKPEQISKALESSGLIRGVDAAITVTLLPDTLPPVKGKRVVIVR